MATAAYYQARRALLHSLIPGKTVLLHNGDIRYRNITASGYPFRGNSHFLYFCGEFPPGSTALLEGGSARVFAHTPSVEEQIWEGSGPDLKEQIARFGLDEILPLENFLAELKKIPPSALTSLPHLDPGVNAQLAGWLGRSVSIAGDDRELALAVIECRIEHDDFSLQQLRRAADITTNAFVAGMSATQPGISGYELLAVMESECLRAGALTGFGTTLTNCGEVLHNPEIADRMPDDALVLADLGAELRGGYSADVTRTWPINGQFSADAKLIYEIVLAMQQAAIERVKPGVLYGDVHLAACRACIEGLVGAEILRGSTDELLERGAHALFFPHGVGHLLGLDVHDLEDLGDLAGYADGQTRDQRFGWNFLRLNRRLRPRMLVTIEPGFYWIESLLHSEKHAGSLKTCLNMYRVEQFRFVHGIRIEDDILVTDTGAENLTVGIPKTVAEVEAVVGTL